MIITMGRCPVAQMRQKRTFRTKLNYRKQSNAIGWNNGGNDTIKYVTYNFHSQWVSYVHD